MDFCIEQKEKNVYKELIIGDVKVYQFPEDKHSIGTNISFINSEENQIIVDAGYSRFTKDILHLVKENPIGICTHFHPDHYDGFRLFNKRLIGSHNYQETLMNFEELTEEITPTILIFEKEKHKFGEKVITFIPSKGHSVDGLIVIVDNIIFVGDDLMYSNDGQPILPYVASTIQNHIDSLIRIKQLVIGKIVIPAHGKIIEDQDFLMKDIDRRIEYLQELAMNKVDIANPKYKSFLNIGWHKSNLSKIQID